MFFLNGGLLDSLASSSLAAFWQYKLRQLKPTLRRAWVLQENDKQCRTLLDPQWHQSWSTLESVSEIFIGYICIVWANTSSLRKCWHVEMSNWDSNLDECQRCYEYAPDVPRSFAVALDSRYLSVWLQRKINSFREWRSRVALWTHSYLCRWRQFM